MSFEISRSFREVKKKSCYDALHLVIGSYGT
jgi:hypothetical protein